MIECVGFPLLRAKSVKCVRFDRTFVFRLILYVHVLLECKKHIIYTDFQILMYYILATEMKANLLLIFL